MVFSLAQSEGRAQVPPQEAHVTEKEAKTEAGGYGWSPQSAGLVCMNPGGSIPGTS